MKYIILRAPAGDAAVLFPREFMHRYVAQLFAPAPVLAAGFVRWSDAGPECYGHSAGLKIASRGVIDSALVMRALTLDMPTG
ncbi:MAG: hypothetical protein IPK66_10660 [Rhodospirillales bacterium]|nr:hypothetical protein [Rhodospirillales bacterium]